MRTPLPVLVSLAAFGLLPASALAQASPSVTVGFPDIEGPLDTAAVQEGVEKRRGAVERCYLPALTTSPGLYGQVRVRLAFGADGQVGSSTLVDQTLGDETVATCIAGVLQVVPLASPPAGAEASATVALRLTPLPTAQPRGKMAERLLECGPPGGTEDSARTVLARIDVDGGRATAIDLRSPQPLDETTIACLTQALQLGPHKTGVGSRWYQWELRP